MYFTCSTTSEWKTELDTFMLVKVVIFPKKFLVNKKITVIELHICLFTLGCMKIYKRLILTFENLVDAVDLFPVASSTTFFTDMHHLLRIISIGNVRSACHHRLRFLEEVIFFRFYSSCPCYYFDSC